MYKYVFLFFNLFITITFFSQNLRSITTGNSTIKIELKFDEPKYTDKKNNEFTVRDYSDFSPEIKAGDIRLPSSQIVIAIPPNSRPSLKRIRKKVKTYTKTIPSIKSNENINLGNSSFSSLYNKLKRKNDKPIVEIKGTHWLRDFYCITLSINRSSFNQENVSIDELQEIEFEINFDKSFAIHDNSPIQITNGYDRVLKSVLINSQIAEQFRSKNNSIVKNEADSWIDYDNEYVKLSIVEDGIYRITYLDLISYGIDPSSINPQKMKIITNGIEIPIYFSGEISTSFTQSDYIEFYGKRNYPTNSYTSINSIDEPYNEYLDRHSKNSIYWLNLTGLDGKRVLVQDSENPESADTIKYYLNRDHYEKNNFLDYFENNIISEQDPNWQSTETWFWGTYGPGSYSWAFNVNNVKPNSGFHIDFKLFGFASNISDNAHSVGLQLNSGTEIYDQKSLNQSEQTILNFDANSDLLNDGSNTLILVSNETDAFPNSVAVDWYDVEYSRSIALINDSLTFRFPASLSGKEYFVKINNAISDNYVLYKIGAAPKKIQNYSLNDLKIIFSDTVNAGDEYIILNEESVKSPIFIYKKTFKNILTETGEAKYLLLTNSTLINAATEYVEFISSNYNISAKAIDVNDIYDQFNYGLLSPYSIKLFLQNSFSSWINETPEYVFLVGEANYDFHNNLKLEDYTENMVPSFGHPVSDNWYVIWDSVSLIPQMSLGRLPAKDKEEFDHYFNKHTKYLDDEYDQWNKSYLLLSGGLDESSRNFSRIVNNNILQNVITPAPVGGYFSFLYSTTEPPTNFGPYKNSFIDSAFSYGAVVISYIGHSGTRIWDNGIEDVSQLNNDLNRSSFITDFGCSTGKFAEPDIVSFSEAHVNGLSGDAIGYIGNSSLGFTSTTSLFPNIFYSSLLIEENTIGEAFQTAKIEFLSRYGGTGSYRIFIYTNTLFADPIISLNIPTKPNLIIGEEDISLPEFLDDNLDSIVVKIKYRNLGRTDTNKFNIKITDIINDANFSKTISRTLPVNNDEIEVAIPVKNLAGKHQLNINLDNTSLIDEIDESDNFIEIDYNVLTSSMRLFNLSKINNKFSNEIKFLNPVQKSANESTTIEIADNNDFVNPNEYSSVFDTIITKVNYGNLQSNKRYFLRNKISGSSDYFETISFINSTDSSSYYFLNDSLSFGSLNSDAVYFESDSLKLSKKNILLSLSSDGFNSGGVASVQLDNVDYANNPQGCGHHIIVFDDKNFKYKESKWFNMWADPDFSQYVHFLDTLSPGNLIAISLSNFCGGAGVNQALIDKLHEYGSTYIDSVKYNTSWLFFGKKGSDPSSSIDRFSSSGIVDFDTTFVTENDSGWFETEYFPEGTKIKNISITGYFNDSSIRITPLLSNSSNDSPESIFSKSGLVTSDKLEYLNESRKKFRVFLRKSSEYLKPTITDFNIDVDLNAELAINYQVVTLDRDSVNQGEDINLSFYVYNVGESKADSFNVIVEIINSDNSREKIFAEIVSSIGSEERKKFNINYNTTSFNGQRTFAISIDKSNEILELYEDNNFFNIPFKVIGDTTKPSLKLTIDGNDIFDGEYISSDPNIKIELSDPSLVPITDTSSVSMFLNNSYITYLGNENISINFSENNPKVSIDYSPVLEDGEYTLRIFGKDASGNISDSSGISKSFIVQNEAKLLNVYNYPNPFEKDTYFTFKLTQIPDEIKIKVFTVSGRLIKEIKLNATQLNYDLNKIYWNGRDDDGDLIANGVYLYKIIMDVGGKKHNITQKLAIVR